eukprot:TRINITY_DN67623_c3_g11_i1.p1 TRINITY_DN67623_c3_g11~~TRINITY_DN67623_c3_g11_i1.p1  ORF type:complete len:191 (-),score=21.60 TRINITY_DN67623_c3_g11_i1:193-765(-)
MSDCQTPSQAVVFFMPSSQDECTSGAVDTSLDALLSTEQTHYKTGFAKGLTEGKQEGHAEGHEMGVQDGFKHGFTLGYVKGFVGTVLRFQQAPEHQNAFSERIKKCLNRLSELITEIENSTELSKLPNTTTCTSTNQPEADAATPGSTVETDGAEPEETSVTLNQALEAKFAMLLQLLGSKQKGKAGTAW